jgi:hypothetical protein
LNAAAVISWQFIEEQSLLMNSRGRSPLMPQSLLLERTPMKSANFLVRARFYLGLVLILGSIAGVAWRFRAARILSYDMLPPTTTSAMSTDVQH